MLLISINLLPKNLQRSREPGYWRLIAVLLPILVLIIIAVMQVLAQLQLNARQRDLADKQLTYNELEPFIRERDALLAQQRDLQEIIAIRDAVEQGQIFWSQEIAEMIETLPGPTESGKPSISISTLSMTSLEDAGASEDYEGIVADAVMDVSGEARDAVVLARYIQSLEDSPYFGVAFQNASRTENEDEEDTFTFNLGVGATVEPPEEEEGLQ